MGNMGWGKGWVRGALGALGVALAACSDGEGTSVTCAPSDPASCAAGLTCEQVGSSGYACLPPVIVSGRVVGALDGIGIAGATIVGLAADGTARTRMVRSGANGSYTLPVSVRRAGDRTPREEALVLRVAASAYQPFPMAPRSALPIELSRAQRDASASAANTFRIENATTTVTLLPRPVAERGGATIEGTLGATEPGGTLITAITGERAASTAIADHGGAFVLFNVPVGAVRLEGHRAGLAVSAKPLDLTASGLTGVTLASANKALSRVTGKLSVVEPARGTTSVVLALASTFDPTSARGEVPPGLRVTNVSGDFAIDDVPPGRYAVLAASENDALVRDPNRRAAGTDVAFVDVPDTGLDVALDPPFEVTYALTVLSPSAEGVQTVPAGPVVLSWNDDASEDGYELSVVDALGTLVHENRAVRSATGAANVSYTLDTSDANVWQTGMIYQFRAVSFREPRSGGRSYLASTEDLKGVFQIGR